MKRLLDILATLAVLGLYAAFVYGFYLLHPGLGWICGVALVFINILSFGRKQAKRDAEKAAARALSMGALSPNEARFRRWGNN